MSKGLCSGCGGHGCIRCGFSGTTHDDVERLMAKGEEMYDMGWSEEDEAAIAAAHAATPAYIDPVTRRLVIPPELDEAYTRAEANLRNHRREVRA